MRLCWELRVFGTCGERGFNEKLSAHLFGVHEKDLKVKRTVWAVAQVDCLR